MEHCVVKLDDKRRQARLGRWQRLALEAAKQCGRDDVPEVAPVMSFTELVDAYADTRFIIPYEQETAPLSEACHDVRTGDAVIAIGLKGLCRKRNRLCHAASGVVPHGLSRAPHPAR